jgi:hypothetical protein
MLKRTVCIFAAVAFLGAAVPTQTAQARDYYYEDDDDFWDMMDPSWWADEFFGDDDDDWWRYRHHRYSPFWGGPYWGSPYGMRPPVIVIQQPENNPQDSGTRPPE